LGKIDVFSGLLGGRQDLSKGHFDRLQLLLKAAELVFRQREKEVILEGF
jgi:hypothetical protein